MSKLTQYLLIFLVLGIVAIIVILKYQPRLSQNIPTPNPTPQLSASPEGEITFILAGDAMFGRAVYAQFHDDLKEAFENLEPSFFQNRDIALLNLEGPIMPNEFTPDTNPNNLMMKFPAQVSEVLKWLNINAVSLANNHTANQGAEALAFTRENLAEKQITTIGDPQNAADLVKSFEKNGLKISIIALNILANTPDIAALIAEQKENSTLVIIFPHWGGEYETIHSATQEKLAQSWIESGADLVVGSHPHVIQDAQIYQNRPIFYCLGNFLFDQTFSVNTQRGLVLAGKISQDKLTLELLPVKSVHLKVQLLQGEEKDAITNSLKKSLGFEADPITFNLK